MDSTITRFSSLLLCTFIWSIVSVDAQPALPVDTSANHSPDCQRLVSVMRVLVGLRTCEIAAALAVDSFAIDRISTSLRRELAALTIGNKRLQVGFTYGMNVLCDVNSTDIARPKDPIQCYWWATPTSIRVFCHGDGFSTSPVWDTTYQVQIDSESRSWSARDTSAAFDLPDSVYKRNGQTIAALLELFDTIGQSVTVVRVESDSTAKIYLRSDYYIDLSIARVQSPVVAQRQRCGYGMFNNRRVLKLAFKRYDGMTAVEYRRIHRVVVLSDPTEDVHTGEK